MENKDYIFKNSFVFVESSNLKVDLYRAFKDEVGYLCEKKFKLYLDKSIMSDTKHQKYLKEIIETFEKLKNILLDSTILSLKEYFELFEFEKKNNMLSESDLKNSLNTHIILKDLDKLFDDFAYIIYEYVYKQKMNTKYGVFVVIKNYFKLADNKPYNNFQEFLDKAFSTILRALNIKKEE